VKSAIDILRDALRAQGYGGLCEPETECGCGLDDFRPCGQDPSECLPAHQRRDGLYCPGRATTARMWRRHGR